MWIWLLLLSVVFIGSTSAAPSTESTNLKRSMEAPGVPTTITSKKMTVRNQDSQAVFEETVVLTRGPLIVHSDKMIVLFTPRNADPLPSGGGTDQHESVRNSSAPKDHNTVSTISNRSVSRVEAIGDVHRVKIKYENGNATCQKAVYFVDGEKIVLTGDPVAWEKGTRVSGKQITIFLAEERSVIEGGSHVRIEGEGASQP